MTAFAGFYFSLENAALILSPTLTAGVDFAVPLGWDQTNNTTLSCDFYTVVPNVLAPIDPEAPWKIGADATVNLDCMACDFEAYFSVDPEKYPNSVEIVEDSNISLTLTGKPGYPVEVWGGLALVYDDGPDKWLLAPVFGIEVHW